MAVYQPLNPEALKPDINPADRNNMAIQAGYNGWEDYQNNANNIQQGGGGTNAQIGNSGGGGAGTGMGLGITAPAALDLTGAYNQLYGSSGISDLEKTASEQEKAYNEAQRKINDNPWLSEATRVGRVQKLSQDYTNRTSNIKNDIAVKKADIETQLQLKMKQFDINSQSAQQAMQQFNTLLEMGALGNASGEDIANIVRSTGLSSAMITSAINKQKEGTIKPQLITSEDDAGNVTITTVDLNTGKVISTNSLGTVGKASKSTGGAGGLTASQSRDALAAAGSLLAEVDRKYQTVGGQAKNIETKYNSAKLKGDKLLSLQEYQVALDQLMNKTGIDAASADDYLTQMMKQQGYSKWKW